ncbi:hypothetical protein V6Z11_D09G038800 [Gossypium hirsutum]
MTIGSSIGLEVHRRFITLSSDYIDRFLYLS